MMTRVEYPDASGINGIEWDFVEVTLSLAPALSLLNDCYDPGRVTVHGELL